MTENFFGNNHISPLKTVKGSLIEALTTNSKGYIIKIRITIRVKYTKPKKILSLFDSLKLFPPYHKLVSFTFLAILLTMIKRIQFITELNNPTAAEKLYSAPIIPLV